MSLETLPAPGHLPVWSTHALRYLERTLEALQPTLTHRLTAFLERLRRMNGAESLQGALGSVVATPFLSLMEALRGDLGLPGDDPRLERIAEGTLALYFQVRVQDDLVDEPDRYDRAWVHLAEVFSSLSQRAFAQALRGNPRFFEFREAAMLSFAEAALWEVDLYWKGQATDDLRRTGRKFLPMAVPLAAVALAANPQARLEPLSGFVTALGTGLQLLNDLLNVREDHSGGRLTPVLRWLYAGGRVGPDFEATSIRLALLSDEALPLALRGIREALVQAEAAALALGSPGMAAIVRERAVYSESIPLRLLSLHLDAGAA